MGTGECENIDILICISSYFDKWNSFVIIHRCKSKVELCKSWCALFLLFISWRSFYSHNIFTIDIEMGVLSKGAFLQHMMIIRLSMACCSTSLLRSLDTALNVLVLKETRLQTLQIIKKLTI